MVETNSTPPTPSSPQTVRKLIHNLPSKAVAMKIREAERLSGAGDRKLAFYLADFKDRKLCKKFKCRSFAHHIENHTGIGVHREQDLARVGRALRRLPLLAEAFDGGRAPWTSVRAAAGIARPDTDADWAEYCRTHRVSEVERRAAELRTGESPRDRSGFDGRPVNVLHGALGR